MYVVTRNKNGSKVMVNLDYVSEIRVTRDKPAHIVAYDVSTNAEGYLGTYEDAEAAEKEFDNLIRAINNGDRVYNMTKVPEKKIIVS